jgi:hypothetical protein
MSDQIDSMLLINRFSRMNEFTRLNDDVQLMRNVLVDYEHTIDKKTQTETNLCKAIDLLYQKTMAYQRYYQWRLALVNKQRQAYVLSLSKHFYDNKLKRVILSCK